MAIETRLSQRVKPTDSILTCSEITSPSRDVISRSDKREQETSDVKENETVAKEPGAARLQKAPEGEKQGCRDSLRAQHTRSPMVPRDNGAYRAAVSQIFQRFLRRRASGIGSVPRGH